MLLDSHFLSFVRVETRVDVRHRPCAAMRTWASETRPWRAADGCRLVPARFSSKRSADQYSAGFPGPEWRGVGRVRIPRSGRRAREPRPTKRVSRRGARRESTPLPDTLAKIANWIRGSGLSHARSPSFFSLTSRRRRSRSLTTTRSPRGRGSGGSFARTSYSRDARVDGGAQRRAGCAPPRTSDGRLTSTNRIR